MKINRHIPELVWHEKYVPKRTVLIEQTMIMETYCIDTDRRIRLDLCSYLQKMFKEHPLCMQPIMSFDDADYPFEIALYDYKKDYYKFPIMIDGLKIKIRQARRHSKHFWN